MRSPLLGARHSLLGASHRVLPHLRKRRVRQLTDDYQLYRVSDQVFPTYYVMCVRHLPAAKMIPDMSRQNGHYRTMVCPQCRNRIQLYAPVTRPFGAKKTEEYLARTGSRIVSLDEARKDED